MKFTPFQAPSSDHHVFNTGLGTELGVTPKQLVDGINAYFTHLFQVIEGDVAHTVEITDDAAHTRIKELEDALTAMQQHMEVMHTIVSGITTAAPTPPQTDGQGAQVAMQGVAAQGKVPGEQSIAPQGQQGAGQSAPNPAPADPLAAALKQATGG